MLKLILIVLTFLSHVAIAVAHVIECIDKAPAVPAYHIAAAGGYVVLGLISLALLALHLASSGAKGEHLEDLE